MTPTEIKRAYQSVQCGHFFDRDTMKFFGDTMRSFGSRRIDGVLYLYRKPSAQVNVFGAWKTVGRDYFGAWEVQPNGGLRNVSDDLKDTIYSTVTRSIRARLSNEDWTPESYADIRG